MPFGINISDLTHRDDKHKATSSHGHHGASSPSKPQYDVDLVTLLTDPQRHDLLNLITAGTELMRTSLLHTFDPMPKKQKEEDVQGQDVNTTEGSSPRDIADGRKEDEEDVPPLPPRGSTTTPPKSSTPKPDVGVTRVKENVAVSRLRHAATASFDHWQQDLLTRIFDILNPPDLESRAGKAAHMQDVIGNDTTGGGGAGNDQFHLEDEEESIASPSNPTDRKNNELENTYYPPIPTGLSSSLPNKVKPLILHSLLLLILSLETYDARSRTLLRIVSRSLEVPARTLVRLEKAVAKTLVTAAKAASSSSSTSSSMSADASKEKHKAENRWNRRIKIGLAGVAGAAVIGITGGLAAPLVAAGIGTVMSGIGLGATAAAGYLGALAGSGALVGTLFGAYGAKMTGQMMERYSKEVEDFGFIKVKPGGQEHVKKDEEEEKKEKEKERARSSHHAPATSFEEMGVDKINRSPSPADDVENNRLTVTIGISGWITEPDDFLRPWRSLSDFSEVYALRWETTALLDLGSAMSTVFKTYAFTYLKFEIIKRTVLASLMAAMWPIALLKIGKVVDNPFNIAKTRAEKAGKILADALVERVQGNRPVSIVAYSLGARVVYSALVELAERRAFGIVENVYLLGAATPSGGEGWVAARSVVSGRVVSVFSEKDYILGFLYRTSAVQFGVAGLQQVKWPEGVESVDVSADVEGHLRYRFLVGDIVGKIGGGEMVDWKVVEEERRRAEEMKRAEEEMEKKAKEKEGGGEDVELEEAARKVEKEKETREERKKEKMMVRDVAQMRIAS
ncbi:hypothetical protein ABW20_dc0106006 [Dactylellina cionopaga]|nr:hypothetical protein ABW20_dc0106006 [Dactylellina cionopaga]